MLAEEARALFCPVGVAVAHALPPGSTPRTARPYALTQRGERALAQGAVGAGALGGDARPILALLAERPTTLASLVRALPKVAVARRLENLERDGLVERRSESMAARARVPSIRIARMVADLDVEQAATTTLARAATQAKLLAPHRGPSERHLDADADRRRCPGDRRPARPRAPGARRDRESRQPGRDRDDPRRRRAGRR